MIKMNHAVVSRLLVLSKYYFDSFNVRYRYCTVPQYFYIDSIWPNSTVKTLSTPVDDQPAIATSHLMMMIIIIIIIIIIIGRNGSF